MNKQYNAEFKKQIVDEYLKGANYAQIKKEYGVAKSTAAGWVKKYSEECQYAKPQSENSPKCAKEIRVLNKKITELEKENLFLKKAAAFFAKEID